MKELPQNLKTTLQEIGELSALLFLHLTIQREGLKGWKVFRNYADEGCDLVLMGPGRQIKLEVKTRQSLWVSRRPNSVQFTITEKEKECAQFILAYWFNRSTFFVVPTSDLRAVSSKGKVLYKFSAGYSEENTDFTDSCRCYVDDWLRIADVMRDGKVLGKPISPGRLIGPAPM
jgi:hypothetical protein